MIQTFGTSNQLFALYRNTSFYLHNDMQQYFAVINSIWLKILKTFFTFLTRFIPTWGWIVQFLSSLIKQKEKFWTLLQSQTQRAMIFSSSLLIEKREKVNNAFLYKTLKSLNFKSALILASNTLIDIWWVHCMIHMYCTLITVIWKKEDCESVWK